MGHHPRGAAPVMLLLGLFAVAAAEGAQMVEWLAVAVLAISAALGVILAVLLGELGDAQIKNLTDRLRRHIGKAVTAEVILGNRSPGGGSTAWQNLSHPVTLHRGPAGRQLIIDISGAGNWRGSNLSFGFNFNGDVPVGPAETKIAGSILPGGVPGFGYRFHARATVTVHPDTVVLHLTANVAGLTASSTTNTTDGGNHAEGEMAATVLHNPAADAQVWIAIAFQTANGGANAQTIVINETRVTYCGGG